jgi:hypothetical protein
VSLPRYLSSTPRLCSILPLLTLFVHWNAAQSLYTFRTYYFAFAHNLSRKVLRQSPGLSHPSMYVYCDLFFSVFSRKKSTMNVPYVEEMCKLNNPKLSKDTTELGNSFLSDFLCKDEVTPDVRNRISHLMRLPCILYRRK